MMMEYEYMHIPLAIIPAKIQHHYNTDAIAYNGFVMFEIRWAMYSLPRYGILTNAQLQQQLAQYGYHQTQHMHGLYRHETRDISFNLVRDNFGIKYIDRANLNHLLNTIQN